MSKNPSPSELEEQSLVEYEVLEASSLEAIRDTDSDNHIIIASKCEDKKLLVVARLHVKDAQHILSKLLTWDKSIQ